MRVHSYLPLLLEPGLRAVTVQRSELFEQNRLYPSAVASARVPPVQRSELFEQKLR